jgi:predicted GNAT family acetyltransferase
MGIVIRDMEAGDAPACAAIACDSEIGRRYGFVAATMAAKLAAAVDAKATRGEELFVAADGDSIVGFAWVDPRGAFSSAPYLRLIAVAPGKRGSGLGSLLLGEFEHRTLSAGRDFCLLVSDFNAAAIAFYERHGYIRRGELPDFACRGVAEVIMAKPRPAGGRS